MWGESVDAVMSTEVPVGPVTPLNSHISSPDRNQGPGAVNMKLRWNP
jgi:hypothetical protein